MAAGFSGAASDGQLEEKVDLSAETDAALKQAESLAAAGQAEAARTLLSGLEKRCRIGNDTTSLIKLSKAVVTLSQSDYDALVSVLQSWATKRSQKSAAVKALVATALPWCVVGYAPVEVEAGEETVKRDKLVKALLELTEGKIFLEKERAQLTRARATILEDAGNPSEAADLLQDVHVETYGSLSKKDKVEFILEQLRLTLAKHDFVRAAIVAGKIKRSTLEEEPMHPFKVTFFELLTILHRHEKDAMALATDYYSMYQTPHIKKDDTAGKEALQATVLFLALAPYGNEQQDLMHRILQNERTALDEMPATKSVLDLFLKKEIIHYPTPHQKELEALDVFLKDDLATHWHDDFYRRIIQHNIRIVSGYYTRIHGKRLAQLLSLEPARLEQELSEMVSDGSLYAKMDRPADIIRFRAQQPVEAILTDWASDIDSLLHLVETTTHLIHKEQMTQTNKASAEA